MIRQSLTFGHTNLFGCCVIYGPKINRFVHNKLSVTPTVWVLCKLRWAGQHVGGVERGLYFWWIFLCLCAIGMDFRYRQQHWDVFAGRVAIRLNEFSRNVFLIWFASALQRFTICLFARFFSPAQWLLLADHFAFERPERLLFSIARDFVPVYTSICVWRTVIKSKTFEYQQTLCNLFKYFQHSSQSFRWFQQGW